MALSRKELPPLPRADLEEISAQTAPLWEEMRGKRLFITGGTGFFGCWLVESFLHINQVLQLEAQATVLTRDPVAFLQKMPHLRHQSALALQEGDVRDFRFPAERYDYIVHAATEASARKAAEEPEQMLSTILTGTARVLAFARVTGTRKLLFISSGAVYGPQPEQPSHVTEEYCGAPDPLERTSVYGEGKRAGELMCALAAGTKLEVKIARCFAFLGPHLPLDAHFAVGNFLSDALSGLPIHVNSSGGSHRSYLYASDLATWLWTILFRGLSARAYNVGSENALTIVDLAKTVARTVNPDCPSQIRIQAISGEEKSRYLPSTARARAELGLLQTVSLPEGLQRTAAWQRLNLKLEPTVDTLSQSAPSAPPEPTPARAHGPFAALRRVLPASEVVRFLMVGVWNTMFAYALFASFVALYVHLLPHKWLVFTADFASLTAKPLSITMAFLCYKHFVFRTKGNYLQEWLRCLAVYGVGTLPELVALPLITKFFLLFPIAFVSELFAIFHVANPAPYLAGIVVAVFTAMYSYFAHKKFSFKR